MESENTKTGLPAGVKRVDLENGLVVILKEDHSSPVATVQAWARAGSVDEGRWMGAGMSHVLEHMLFKGTTTRPASRIDQEVQGAGGQMNACTSFNYTLYYIDIPAAGVSVAVDILCDIMCNATLPADELEKERQVILREMDMGQDDPDRRSSRRLFESAYQVSPYRHPVIGYKDIFEKFTREDLLDYYRLMYAPNNLFFVVVGDIDSEAVEAQIRGAFSTVKRGAIPPSVLPSEPPQTGPRIVEEPGVVELCRAHLAWHIPHALHPDIPVLGVISGILGSGRSSRLYRKIREEMGLVQAVDSWIYAPGEQGLFGVSAEIEKEKYEEAIRSILLEVEKLRTEPVPLHELEKVKKRCVVGLLSARKTTSGQATELGGSWLRAGDLNFSNRSLERIQKVTPDEVLQVAKNWFGDQNRVLYSLMPQGEAQAEASDRKQCTSGRVQKSVLPNGLRILTRHDDRLPFIQFRLAFEGGLRAEEESTNGYTLMMSRLMLKGTARRTAEEIAKEIESVGGSIENWSGHSSFGFSVEVLKEDFELGLDILSDVVLNPVFPAKALELERGMILADIRAEKDHMLSYTLKRMRTELFGPVSFGLSSSGGEECIRTVTQADVKAHWSRLVRPDNAVLSIFGDIEEEEAILKALQEKWLNWEPNGKNRFPESPAFKTGRRDIFEKQDKKQAVVCVGYPSVSIHDPLVYPILLLQESCSSLGSRLFMRIREELALAYYVGAYEQSGTLPGYFCFYAGTELTQAKRVVEEIFSEAEKLRREGLSPEELDRTKAKLLGQRAIRQQDIGTVARTAAVHELLGLGYDFAQKEDELIRNVTLEEVQIAARQILNPENCVVSIVGPEGI